MLSRRSFMVATPIAIAATLYAYPERAAANSGDAGPVEAVVSASRAFLDSLSSEQRDQVLYDAADPALRQWIYFPSRGDRNGLPFERLTDVQRAAAFAVARAILSESGYAQFIGVITAEDELGVRNGESHVNSGRYFIAFFGSPDPVSRFTVQINGHHLAINTTYANGAVSPTPAFTGVDPVEIAMNGRRERPMARKTDAVAALLNSLSSEERIAAEIGAIDDVRVGTGASNSYPRPEGLVVTRLGADRQARIADVVGAWVGDTDRVTADLLMRQYQAEFENTRLAWSGNTDPDARGTYLRLDGPRLWIEFSNVGRFGNGDNHYHSIFRDKQGDYLGS